MLYALPFVLFFCDFFFCCCVYLIIMHFVSVPLFFHSNTFMLYIYFLLFMLIRVLNLATLATFPLSCVNPLCKLRIVSGAHCFVLKLQLSVG
jgi:hypothetical protein